MKEKEESFEGAYKNEKEHHLRMDDKLKRGVIVNHPKFVRAMANTRERRLSNLKDGWLEFFRWLGKEIKKTPL